MQLSADSFACAMHEEQEHWMHLHLKAVGRKENSAKLKRRFDGHPLRIKDTAQEFHASFDLCKCRAYALPAPKPQIIATLLHCFASPFTDFSGAYQ